MSPRYVVTGTDTGIGKTVFSAALTNAIKAHYWKPVQAGLDEETDSEIVARLGNVPVSRIVPEAYRLTTPASPHFAARIDGVEIDVAGLMPPDVEGPLVIEGAGGLLVPLTETLVMADLFARWQIPVVLCARTSLGTINHTLLSIEAIKYRNIPIFGIAFLGDENAESQRIIGKMSGVRILGRLPFLNDLDFASLADVFAAHFDISLFAKGA